MNGNVKRSMKWKPGVLLVGALLALNPASGLAQTSVSATGVAQGVLYETLEAPPAEFTPSGARIMPGVILPSSLERLAQAKEAGTLAGSGTLEFLTGNVTVTAQSRVPFDPATSSFGVGKVNGTFSVNGGGGAVAGKLDGQLDMSPLTSTNCGGPCPFALTNGMWSTQGATSTSGTYSGVFLVPFEAGSGVWAYLNPATGQIEPLQAHEYGNDGTPLIKLLVTLTQ